MTSRGMTLLEVLVALVVLGVAGMALTTASRQALYLEEGASSALAQLRRADTLLARQALLTRRALDQQLGDHPEGGLVIRTQRPRDDLFRVAVLRPDGHELAATVVHRPEGAP